jgi:WD40 repeat protein
MSDGKKLISGSYRQIRIFDTATWQQIAILKCHRHIVSAISLSPNNRLLASASNDSTVHLWNLDTMSEKDKGALEGYYIQTS